MIERCGDRQRKCDGIEKWPFHLFVESLPVMLQISLLLLACGLCRNMWSINTSVAGVLITLTALGVLFYLVIVVAGTSSYACPFQTPASSALRGLWRGIRPHTTLPARPGVAAGAYIFQLLSSNIAYSLWENIAYPVVSAMRRFKQAIVQMTVTFNQWVRGAFERQQHAHHTPPAIPLEEIQENSRVSPEPNSPSHNNNPLPPGTNSPTHDVGSLYHNSNPSSQDTPLPPPGNVEPWVVREGLTAIQKTNAKDVRCVSWILKSITDPEALDAAIRLAGTIRWFEDGIGFEPPYNIIVSTFHTCLDSTGIVYPGSRDRAYYCAQAIVWIHIRAMCVSVEYAQNFPLPSTRNHTTYDLDLYFLLLLYDVVRSPELTVYRGTFMELNTPAYMRWASNALLHFCWTKQGNPDALGRVFPHFDLVGIPWDTIPLDAILNLLLVWSIYLGCSIDEELLQIPDKTYGIFHSSL